MTFCAQTRSGSLRTRLFACNKTQRVEDSDEKDEEEEDAQAAFKARCCRLIFAIWTIFCKNHVAFVALPIAGMVSLWAALWANEWANGQGDSWALRMPYAYLTHSLRKSLTIRFQLIQVEGPTSKPDTLRKRNLWEKLTHPYATQGFAYTHGSYDPPKTNQYMRGFGTCSPGMAAQASLTPSWTALATKSNA